MKKFVSIILACVCISLAGCSPSTTKGSSEVQADSSAEKDYYENLTQSDKLLYNDMLLKVVNKLDEPASVRVSSIRINDDTDSKKQIYWILLTHDMGNNKSQKLYYGYIIMEGDNVLFPVSFQNDPTKWDFAEESKFDVDGINNALTTHEKKLADIRHSTQISQSEIADKMKNCRTFFYKSGDVQGEHSIIRVDLENGEFQYLTFTGKGTSGDGRVLQEAAEGEYSIEVDSEGVAYLVLDGQERCLITFDKSNDIAGIMATGYTDFNGDVDTLELNMTDTWQNG